MRILGIKLNVFIVLILWATLTFVINPKDNFIKKINPLAPSTAHANAIGPSARYGAAMAFDSKRNRVVLFGGCVDTCRSTASRNNRNDTWELEGAVWRKISTENAPSPRLHAGMIYDAQRDVMVLFGGYRLNDTWEYDGTDWTQVTTQDSPPMRVAIDLAYDSKRHVVILSSGNQPPFCNTGANYTDIWEYDGTNWTERIASGCPFNELPTIAYDPIRQQTVHFGGRHNCNLFSQTWAYNGTDITQLSPIISPPPTGGGLIRFDAALEKIVLFGGCIESNSSRCSQYSNDLWAFDGVFWEQLNIATKPEGRYYHAMTFDTNRQRLIMFGGCADYYWGFRCEQLLGDLWEFDGTEWTKLEAESVYMPLLLR